MDGYDDSKLHCSIVVSNVNTDCWISQNNIQKISFIINSKYSTDYGYV